MAGRVPILCQHDMVSMPDHIVDQRHDLVAAGNGKRTARAKVVLQVDDNKRFVGHGAFLFCMQAPVENAADATGRRNLTRWPPASTSGSITNAWWRSCGKLWL